MTETGVAPRRRAISTVLLAAVLVVAELQALSLLYDYQTGLKPACFDTFGQAACGLLGRAVPRGLGLVAATALFAVARPRALGALVAGAAPAGAGLVLNLAGFALLALPALLLPSEGLAARFAPLSPVWLAGAAMAGLGALGMIAAPGAWRDLAAANWRVLAPLAALGLFTPELARMLQPLWQVEAVTDVTFRAVVALLELAGYAPDADAASKVIGANGFEVEVSAACSGVEGFALISLFLTIYLVLFRSEIAFPAAFVLYPIGILASWAFNVVRIAALLVIGIEGAPDLAIGGFHSRAGWLAFTVLAFVLIFAARNIPVFRREGGARSPVELPPFLRDPAAAMLLPFAVFMLTAHLAPTVSETPGELYPWRALAMAAALALFWPVIRALPWRLDPLALLSGLAIGALWVATSPAAEGGPPYGALTGTAFAIWAVARVAGTGLLVPVIEELFFRGYLQGRLAGGHGGWRLAAAILVSAGLFAVLHDRWLAAFLSGLVFGVLAARSGRVTDAIVSHAAANLAIAAWAVAAGDWSVI